MKDEIKEGSEVMKTPREKYDNDPEYHNIVNLIESFIERAKFTPSELREAAIYACIRYEIRHHQAIVFDFETERAFKALEDFGRRTPKEKP